MPDSEPDLLLLGEVIHQEVIRTLPSVTEFAKLAMFDRTTAYRIFKGDPRLKSTILWKAEEALGWPEGSAKAITNHDLDWLEVNNFPDRTMARIKRILAERESAAG